MDAVTAESCGRGHGRAWLEAGRESGACEELYDRSALLASLRAEVDGKSVADGLLTMSARGRCPVQVSWLGEVDERVLYTAVAKTANLVNDGIVEGRELVKAVSYWTVVVYPGNTHLLNVGSVIICSSGHLVRGPGPSKHIPRSRRTFSHRNTKLPTQE